VDKISRKYSIDKIYRNKNIWL